MSDNTKAPKEPPLIEYAPMKSQWRKITPEDQPVFPCWLWGYGTQSASYYYGTNWRQEHVSSAFTHWCPNQPEAPTSAPTATDIHDPRRVPVESTPATAHVNPPTSEPVVESHPTDYMKAAKWDAPGTHKFNALQSAPAGGTLDDMPRLFVEFCKTCGKESGSAWLGGDIQNAIMFGVRTLERELAEANERADNAEALGIHTCHDDCQRPMCKMRRELAEAKALLKQAQRRFELISYRVPQEINGVIAETAANDIRAHLAGKERAT